MVQSREQSEGKRKCRGEGEDFLLILIPQRKEGRNSKPWRSGSQGKTVSPCDHSRDHNPSSHGPQGNKAHRGFILLTTPS